MGFTPDAEVEVREQRDDPRNWTVMREIVYDGESDRFVVPGGDDTDFASVPRLFVWLLPRYGAYTKAAILHDHLWRKEVPRGTISLPEADAILRRAMRELGVSFLQRWMMWAAVRLGALTKPGGRKRWLRDSWAVLPVLVVALPVVIPPAIAIALGLLLFETLEAIFYVPLKITKALKQRLNPAGAHKEVNPPSLDISTTG